jgi:hypothetical protein
LREIVPRSGRAEARPVKVRDSVEPASSPGVYGDSERGVPRAYVVPRSGRGKHGR